MQWWDLFDLNSTFIEQFIATSFQKAEIGCTNYYKSQMLISNAMLVQHAFACSDKT